MTWSREITLWCDGVDCEVWERFTEYTVKAAVRRAREKGWSSPSWDEHYCPECSQ